MRVGLFGGTFDPPHLGHLLVAQDVVEALGLDHLRFVVAGRPPHKDDPGITPAEVRVAMVEAAVAGDARFRVSRMEVEREGPSYTVDTLRALHEAEPGVTWHLVMGTDQLAGFHTWREPREVARRAHLVVLSREGVSPAQVDPEVDVVYDSLRVTRVDVSSTEIRERVRAGRPIRYRVPDPVRAIIHERRLYRGADEGVPAR